MTLFELIVEGFRQRRNGVAIETYLSEIGENCGVSTGDVRTIRTVLEDSRDAIIRSGKEVPLPPV